MSPTRSNILIEKGLNDQPVLQLDNDTEGGTFLFYLNEEEDTAIEKINILGSMISLMIPSS